jgi:hypothetical protein
MVMIYQFKITSPESRNFQLDLEISAAHTFYDLHFLIQKSINYESHQLASFFVPGRNGWKRTEISLLTPGMNGGAYLNMNKTRIEDFITPELQPLIYTYDFIDDRSFFIELTGIVMEKNHNEPIVTSKQGDAPVQVLEEDTGQQEMTDLQEEEVLMDFGILDDYAELYGEMEDF